MKLLVATDSVGGYLFSALDEMKESVSFVEDARIM